MLGGVAQVNDGCLGAETRATRSITCPGQAAFPSPLLS